MASESHLSQQENQQSALNDLDSEAPSSPNLFDERENQIFENSDSNDSARTLEYEVPQENENRNEEVHNEVCNSLDAVEKESTLVEEPASKIRIVSVLNDSRRDDWDVCSICFEYWSNTGEHRLVALKCGHLFGFKCVERWLKAQTLKQRSCPTCKSKAAIKDIRCIYAKRLVAADASEVKGLQEQIRNLEIQKRISEQGMMSAQVIICNLEKKIANLEQALLAQGAKLAPRKNYKFSLEKNLLISKEGECRVITYNPRSYNLCVSQKSTNTLFPGYGIRYVSCIDEKPGAFVHLHQKPIRDIRYSQDLGVMMSVALDGTARFIERGAARTTIQTDAALWSCAWDFARENELYLAGGCGTIFRYDLRNPSEYIQRASVPNNRSPMDSSPVDRSPVVSLYSTKFGLLACSLQTVSLWTRDRIGQLQPQVLPISGPFMSMAYDTESEHVAVCGKPTLERGKISIFKLSGKGSDVRCELAQTLNGSKKGCVMSKCEWVRAPGASWLAAHSESEEALVLHGAAGIPTATLPASEPALDVCSYQFGDSTFIASLSAFRVRVYKAF